MSAVNMKRTETEAKDIKEKHFPGCRKPVRVDFISVPLVENKSLSMYSIKRNKNKSVVCLHCEIPHSYQKERCAEWSDLMMCCERNTTSRGKDVECDSGYKNLGSGVSCCTGLGRLLPGDLGQRCRAEVSEKPASFPQCFVAQHFIFSGSQWGVGAGNER
jgi:hypothetical protein